MKCPGIDVHNPFVWALLAGFFLGAAIAESVVIPGRRKNPEKTRTWKWVWVCIFTACFIGTGVLGFFLSGPGEFLTRNVLFFGGAAAAVCGTGFRFWKHAGVPLVMLLIALGIYLSMVLAPFSCLTKAEQIGWFRVLSAPPDEIRAEFNLDEETAFIELETETVRPEAAVVTIPKYFIFYGGKVYYHFLSLGTGEAQTGKVEIGIKRAERMSRLLPGIQFRHEKAEAFTPDLFQKFNIILNPNGTLSLEAEY